MTNPACPVTGEPAVRLIQWVPTVFLADLWRAIFHVEAGPSLGPHDRIGLWESPTGLYFFDPATEGDHAFYAQFYEDLLKRKLWSQDAVRDEFKLAAAHIKPGEQVLDVGCGFASFRHLIPDARYVGLDPNFGASDPAVNVIKEPLSQHVATHAGVYDAVCAFEVIEHLQSPLDLFADMVRTAKPGGLVMVGVPHHPSAFTQIPNYVLNAPPHHLTWWTQSALESLAERGGAYVESIEQTRWNETDSLLYWMARCSPIRCRDVFFKPARSWYASAMIGFLAARLIYAVKKIPRKPNTGAGLFMVARRPV